MFVEGLDVGGGVQDGAAVSELGESQERDQGIGRKAEESWLPSGKVPTSMKRAARSARVNSLESSPATSRAATSLRRVP